jgi:hypothetical protein
MAVMRRAKATRFALPPASLDKQQKLIVLFLQGSVSRWMALIALAFMWTGAQAPLYLFGEPSNLHFPLPLGAILSLNALTSLTLNTSQLAPRSTSTATSAA